jgi:hypothetical protein
MEYVSFLLNMFIGVSLTLDVLSRGLGSSSNPILIIKGELETLVGIT